MIFVLLQEGINIECVVQIGDYRVPLCQANLKTAIPTSQRKNSGLNVKNTTPSDIDRKKHQLICDRLELVQMITSLKRQVRRQDARQTLNDGWSHPWIYFDSLRNYLLLTCFDLLGQPTKYLDFGSWLKAAPVESERSAAIQAAESANSLVEKINVVHDCYIAKYGTKNSFYGFVRSLPADVSANLYYSIEIRKINTNNEPHTVDQSAIYTDDDKVNFLYRLRNAFTHKSMNIGSEAGVFSDADEWTDFEGGGVFRKGYTTIFREEKNGYFIEYSVRDWPDVLSRVVEAVLAKMPNCSVYDNERRLLNRGVPRIKTPPAKGRTC